MSHTTDYLETFIEVAEDCPVTTAAAPPVDPEKMTIAAWQFELLRESPYGYTSDDLLFEVQARRSGIGEADRVTARQVFFDRPQACLRSSPLSKRYGWGTHHDSAGRVALVGLGTEEYARFAADPAVRHRKAMRNSRG
jgi:hypothetical protein